MALRYMDSFDHFVTADITRKWNDNFNGAVISPGNGRRGTASLRCTTNAHVQKTFDNQATWVLGWAFRIAGLPGTSLALAHLVDGGTIQVDVSLDNAGRLFVSRGGGAVLGTSGFALQTNVYYYLEWLATIHGTTGTASIRVDGTPVLTLTNVNTQASANAYANVLRLGFVGGSAAGIVDVDDVYVCDGTGAAPANTFLGDCRVDLLLPSADGANSAWTPSTGTVHSVLVDEPAPNDDTDYVSTSSAFARESHVMADLPALTNPAFFGVQHVIAARKDDVGLRQMASLLRSGATTQLGPTLHTIASTYAYYREVYETDPATGVAWTQAGLNAVEAGMENR